MTSERVRCSHLKKNIFPVAVRLAVKTMLYLNKELNNELEDSIIIITEASSQPWT